MKRGDVTPLGNLRPGDVFYFLSDRKRLPYVVLHPRKSHERRIFIRLSALQGWGDPANASSKVVFLHNSTV